MTDTDTRGWPSEAGTLEEALDAHRRELTAHRRRMLGSGFEADDAVQETMVRAWCRIDGFEGRSSYRSWLYRIATNVCIDMRRKPERRAIPIDLGQSSSAGVAPRDARAKSTWVSSTHARGNGPHDSEPAELAASREAVRHAFVVALQLLPPRQRAVLILQEVLRWHAREVADLLGTTVVSVNSALQRARATLETVSRDSADPAAVSAEQRALLVRYVDAFERQDVASLVKLARATPEPRPSRGGAEPFAVIGANETAGQGIRRPQIQTLKRICNRRSAGGVRATVQRADQGRRNWPCLGASRPLGGC